MRRRRKRQPWLKPETLWHEYEVSYGGEGGVVAATSEDQALWLAYNNKWHDDPTRNVGWLMLFVEFKRKATRRYIRPHQPPRGEKLDMHIQDFYQCDRCGARFQKPLDTCPNCRIQLKKIRTIELTGPTVDSDQLTLPFGDTIKPNPYDREVRRGRRRSRSLTDKL